MRGFKRYARLKLPLFGPTTQSYKWAYFSSDPTTLSEWTYKVFIARSFAYFYWISNFDKAFTY